MNSISRRAFLTVLPGVAAAADDEQNSDLVRLRDPATENEVTRYTNPKQYSALLLPTAVRSISRRQSFLLFSSDRSGSLQLWRLDLKSGETRQLSSFEEGMKLGAATMLPDERSACVVHGSVVEALPLGAGKSHVVHEGEGGFTPETLVTSDDGRDLYVLESADKSMRIRVTNFLKRVSATVVEEQSISGMRPRPRSTELIYRSGSELRWVKAASRRPVTLKTSGAVRQAFWRADGSKLLYLSTPTGATRVELREIDPDSSEDKLVARTSQFVSFARNSDASAFVGVSGSKAAPYVVLLVRSARRELTLTEHKASNAEAVVVLFTPDSQRILYHTDREGRWSIYGINAEKLVEKTDL